MDLSTRATRSPSPNIDHPTSLASGTEPRGEPVVLSLVIPVFNEEATLDALFASIRDRLGSLDVS